jgi:uncharacterized protein involved in exopolysaccharide biosynthesis
MFALDQQGLENMEVHEQEDEVSLLDLMLVVAENIRLLILGPLLAGLLALAAGYALPQKFVSNAILSLPAAAPTPTQAAAIMVSPIVLDPIIGTMGLMGDQTLQAARADLALQIKATAGKDLLLRLDVTAETPVAAQMLANAIIDNWLKSTAPGELDRADLEKRLGYAQKSLDAVTRLIDRLTAEGAANLNQPLTRGEAGTSIVAVGELQARYLADVINIPRTLRGLSRDVVVQPPTLPTEPVSSKKALMATLAALGTGFALLLFVFMRAAWRGAAQDPEAAQKQIRLRAALGFK